MFSVNKKILMFATAGVVNTGIDWFVFFLMANLYNFNNGEIFAKFTGAVGGISSAFILNALWVFRESFSLQLKNQTGFKSKTMFLMVKYLQTISVYFVGMLVNVVIFTLCLNLGTVEILSLAFAAACSFLVNFLLSKKYVFNSINL